MQTVADIERPLKERIAALEAERDGLKQRADVAEAKLAAVREIVQRKMTAPVHTRDDHSGCDWCKVAEVLK